MGESARIHNVEALKDARAALAQFAEQVSQALASVDADVQRISQWLNSDRPNFWKLEVRHRENKVESLNSEIRRKRIVAAPDPASVVLEERRLERLKASVEEARRRLESTRRWAPIWDREAMLYKGSTRSLTEALHSDIPRALAILAKLMESIDEYAALAPPSGADPDAPPPPPGPMSAPEKNPPGVNKALPEDPAEQDDDDGEPPRSQESQP